MGRFMALTTFDNQTYISMHGYYVQDWCCIPILFSIKCIIKRSNAQNLTKVILVVHLLNLGAWHKEYQLLCFGANGVSNFQGVQNGVIVQIQDLHAFIIWHIKQT
jgi:hypothetical protein